MHTFKQQNKSSQQGDSVTSSVTSSVSNSVPSRATSQQRTDVASILRSEAQSVDSSENRVAEREPLLVPETAGKEQPLIGSTLGVRLQAKLTVNKPGDAYEQEADRVAEQVMRMPESSFAPTPEPHLVQSSEGMQRAQPELYQPLQRKCATCSEEEELLQTKRSDSSTVEQGTAPNSVHSVLASSGRPLDPQTRAFMEPRFGRDFSDVQVHDGARADEASAAVNARAFTVGDNIVFRQGQFAPHTQAGRSLLAHELTHVVQQGRAERAKGEVVKDRIAPVTQRAGDGRRLQRDVPTPVDPLCASYDYAAKKTEIEGLVSSIKATPDVEKRLKLIQALKWILRCGAEAETTEITTTLNTGLGATEASALWAEAGTAFGGYRGAYPGYYGGAKGRLKRLGVSEIEGYDAFSFTPGTDSNSKFLRGRERTATTEAPVLTATDLLYFYGHQYAQYDNPGVFANWHQTRFIDLRALDGKGDFSRVKLIVSTSCATCCKEAVEVFSPLFPNAVILGYRKSAPKKGEDVRNDFDKSIRALKRPLLLDQAIDVNAIIEVWKTVVKRHHPREDKRLPGYLQGGTVHYLELGVWKSMPATDAGNSCYNKGSTIEEASH
ncbi:DUF4157 domain-containing protein [Pseudomonadota bacterium]